MEEYRPGTFFPGFSQATQEEGSRDGRFFRESCPRCGVYGNGLPFYMTYPLPMFWEEEDTALRDLEYLISFYPRQAKHFQGKINRILDTLDYRGSMIYDEYPDRLAIQRLSDQVAERLMKEEAAEGRMGTGSRMEADKWMEDGNRTEAGSRTEDGSRMEAGRRAEENMRPVRQDAAAQGGERERELIQILLLHEIYRRRQNRNPGRGKIL